MSRCVPSPDGTPDTGVTRPACAPGEGTPIGPTGLEGHIGAARERLPAIEALCSAAAARIRALASRALLTSPTSPPTPETGRAA